jgi:hypothetical protein
MHGPISSGASAQQHFHAQTSYYRFGALSDANIEFLYHAQHSIVTHALHLAILYMGLAVATVFVACQSTDY